ncbi:DUF6602 domain-containing protein [Rhizobium oryzicola]|uniref:DUF6602 domain-containing protein n=1 Tax=Rhizobium oryzicola TaxID=1232668 RepID=A0ABT8T0G4_9HYPH|nr:DUF6602 domain-containing protein [Rhizobium oryzicola]MDO1583643.1 hypothetical protein [Rhizobium oryzicola]
MPTLNDLRKIYHHELQTILYESELLLQKEGGLNGELRTSGAIAENFVKRIFSKVICPSHINVTSGYVAAPNILKSDKNLRQCDLLLYDSQYPPIVTLRESGIDVIPQELVLGIVEIKRSLNKESFSAAVRHIRKICSDTDLLLHKQDLTTNIVNIRIGRHNNSSCAPVFGIVALRSQISSSEMIQILDQIDFSPDFVLCLDGTGLVPAFLWVTGIHQSFIQLLRDLTPRDGDGVYRAKHL